MEVGPLLILVLVATAALSFLMSGMEAGVHSLSRLRIRQLKRKGNRSAAVLLGYLDRSEDFLATLLVGNTLSNFVFFGILAVLLTEKMPGRYMAAAVVFAGLAFAFYGLVELLPKQLFRKYPNRLCLFSARIFRGVHWTLRPLVWLADMVAAMLLRWTGGRRYQGHIFGNRDELRFLMQDSGNLLSSDERTMVNRVLDLQSRTVGHLTLPFDRVTTATPSTPVGEILRLCRELRLSRIPLRTRDKGVQRCVGIVDLSAIIFRENVDPAQPASDFLQPALFLPQDLRVDEALGRMQRAGRRMAIVMGNDGAEVGVLVSRDVIRSIFGEVTL